MEAAGMGISFLFVFIALAIIGLAIPVALGVYIYKDATGRGMNAALWTAVVILVPSFIGLIIYLIMRNEQSESGCPRCGGKISKNFSVCPECGYVLKQACPNCSQPLSYDWNICPNCANPVPEHIKISNPVKTKKDKGLKILLAVLIIVPLLIFVVSMVLGFIFMADSSADIVFSSEIMAVKPILS